MKGNEGHISRNGATTVQNLTTLTVHVGDKRNIKKADVPGTILDIHYHSIWTMFHNNLNKN